MFLFWHKKPLNEKENSAKHFFIFQNFLRFYCESEKIIFLYDFVYCSHEKKERNENDKMEETQIKEENCLVNHRTIAFLLPNNKRRKAKKK